MIKELLIFGAYGALGRGVTSTLIEKDYDKIFLFDPHIEKDTFKGEKIENIKVQDLSKEENVIAAFNNIKPSKDTIFFLFSTIGGYFGGKNIFDTDVKDWDNIFNKNLKTSFLLAKHFSMLVKESGGGSICFTSALSSVNLEQKKAAYSISKNAINNLVKTLSLEGAKYRLSANAIAPYIIDTPSNRKWMQDSDFETWIKPKEIGNLLYSIFNNFNFVAGNIIELSNRFRIGEL